MAAASLSPPLLVVVLLLLLATAATTQCHRHKRHRHHHAGAKTPKTTAGATAANMPATVHAAICHTTPHPVSCLAAVAAHLDVYAAAKVAVVESSAVSVGLLLPPNVLAVVLDSLRGAVSTLAEPVAGSLRRGAAQDCLELHAATLGSLSRSASLLAAPAGESALPAVRAHLAAALINKATCLDGLAGAASGPGMNGLLASLDDAYEHVSNSLALVARRGGGGVSDVFAAVVAGIRNRRLLQEDNDDDDSSGDGDNNGEGNEKGSGDDDRGDTDQPAVTVITVAKDGTENFRTVGEAVSAAPNNSGTRTVIHVKAGTYEENVEVPAYKTNIALVGEGRDTTVITGSRSAADGWTTFRSATFGNRINILLATFWTSLQAYIHLVK
uniref:Pectinesterase inhibitor domain-containing protein n=1 Tax=Arundo donax TaxID=35708 RepID=A0A0A9G8A9_ARUDO